MSGELKHALVGTDLSQTEWESVVAHTIDGAAVGDILYWDGSSLVKIAIGTAGQILTVNSGATAPEWASGIGDDKFLTFGGVVSMGWETADADAHAFIISINDAGAGDIPAMILGDEAILNTDLTLFTGLTFPSFIIMDGDLDSYLQLTWNSDDWALINAGGSGRLILQAANEIQIRPSGDTDDWIEIATVSNSPNIYPDTDNTGSCGTATKRWSKIYANQAYYDAYNANTGVAQIRAGTTDTNTLAFEAKDTGVGLVEVAKMVGAADPYFSMGGSQQFKFYNSGVATFGGDVTIGSSKLIGTSIAIKDAGGDVCAIRDDTDSAYAHIYLAWMGVYSGIDFLADAKELSAPNADNNYIIIKARDNTVGRVEIARMAGAADPYFSMGGSQEHKFTNAGLAGFFSQTPASQPAHLADLNTSYGAGDLDTEAEIITAFNTTNGRINDILAQLATLGLQAAA